MPHTATTIYSETRNGVKYGVSLLSDVCPVLGITTQHLTYACANTHGRTNKWAKFKPERNSATSPLTLTQRQNNNFGLQPADKYTSISEFVNAVANGTFNPGWDYLPPRPGYERSRLGDFDGYNHEAKNPFGELPNGFVATLTTDSTIPVTIPASAPESPADPSENVDYLQMSDFKNSTYDFRNWYFGVLLRNSSHYLIATTKTTFSQANDWQVSFGWLSTSYAGEYTAIPFIANKQITQGGDEPTSLRIVGIGSSGVSVKLQTTSEKYVPFLNCIWQSDTSNTFRYFMSIQNTSATAVTFTKVIIRIAKTDSGTGSESVLNLDNITVPAKSTWTKEGTVTVSYSGLASAVYQFCSLITTGNAISTPWMNFEEEDQPEDAAG